MIFDVNEENLDLLALTACLANVQSAENCMLKDDDTFDMYSGSCIDTCRACWLKWLSKESEDNYE